MISETRHHIGPFRSIAGIFQNSPYLYTVIARWQTYKRKCFRKSVVEMWKISMQEDGDDAALVPWLCYRSSADTSYWASVEYRLFILARFPHPPLDKRDGSTLLFLLNGCWSRPISDQLFDKHV